MTTKSIKDLNKALMTNISIKGLHELFDVDTLKKLMTKTDISDNEMKIILKLLELYNEFGVKKGTKMLESFMLLKLSNKRKSRKEIIDIIKGDMERESRKSIGGFLTGRQGNPMM